MAKGVCRCLGSRIDVEFKQDIGDVARRGRPANGKQLSNLAVRPYFGQEAKHFEFTRGQTGRVLIGWPDRRRASCGCGGGWMLGEFGRLGDRTAERCRPARGVGGIKGCRAKGVAGFGTSAVDAIEKWLPDV